MVEKHDEALHFVVKVMLLSFELATVLLLRLDGVFQNRMIYGCKRQSPFHVRRSTWDLSLYRKVTLSAYTLWMWIHHDKEMN